VVNQGMLADYTAHNPVALKVLLDKHGVDMRPYKDAFSRKVYASYRKFFQQIDTMEQHLRAGLPAGTQPGLTGQMMMGSAMNRTAYADKPDDPSATGLSRCLALLLSVLITGAGCTVDRDPRSIPGSSRRRRIGQGIAEADFVDIIGVDLEAVFVRGCHPATARTAYRSPAQGRPLSVCCYVSSLESIKSQNNFQLEKQNRWRSLARIGCRHPAPAPRAGATRA